MCGMFRIIFLALFIVLMQASCTKDKTTKPNSRPFICDSTVNYTKYIVPIFNAHCRFNGCHTGPYPAAGISLTDYNDCKLQTLNGSLLPSIRHEFGYAEMRYPRGSPALSGSLIGIIQCRKDHGCPL
jgi:hypothetical protein